MLYISYITVNHINATFSVKVMLLHKRKRISVKLCGVRTEVDLVIPLFIYILSFSYNTLIIQQNIFYHMLKV